MKKIILSLPMFILPLAILGGWCGASAAASSKGTLLKAVVLNMGNDSATITNARYDQYFKQGSAATGVPAVIAAGKFYLNGLAIPATEQDFLLRNPNGYQVNQVPWLYYDVKAGTWKGGYKGQASAVAYDAAALAVATGIVAGLEVRLYDTDNDGYADMVDADFLEGAIINQISKNSDGSYRLYRGDIDLANKTTDEGATFDGPHFSVHSGEIIKAANFDTTILAGDVGLFWYGAYGWHVKRAKEVNGMFVDGADHAFYKLDGTTYGDAMRFSRDSLFISNRPGEFVNAQKYFGLNNNREGLKVSLWLVPTTNPGAQGAPVGMTSNASSAAFLAKAISVASARLASVVVSVDGSDVPVTHLWVSQAAYTQLDTAIRRAHKALASTTSTASLRDYQIYLLYLNLNGGGHDIGARFAGFNYAGFDRQVRAGQMK